MGDVTADSDRPDRQTADAAPSVTPDTWSVTDLNESIGECLRDAFPRELWVRGQIHDLKRPASGHVYFSLVDGGDDGAAADAKVAVVLTARDKVRVNRLLKRSGGRVRMTDGTEVRIRGRVEFYEARGQVQLRMVSIDPAFTLGQLAVARAELIARLAAEDLVDANRRRPVPMAPMRVGLVTSVGSAAHADASDELARSRYAFEIETMDVRVQGIDSVASITQALAWLSTQDLDIVVLVRGGGATTDLAAFDTEDVARAIAACRHPVITGVGHEIDTSVADEVAHTAAKTPTAAAQHLVGLVARAHDRADAAFSDIVTHTRRRLRRADDHLAVSSGRATAAAVAATRSEARRIDDLASRLGRNARAVLHRHGVRRDDDAVHLSRVARRRLATADATMELVAARVAVADPARALARGWTITRRDDGTIVRSRHVLRPGDTLHTTFIDGTVSSTVDTEETP